MELGSLPFFSHPRGFETTEHNLAKATKNTTTSRSNATQSHLLTHYPTHYWKDPNSVDRKKDQMVLVVDGSEA